MRELIQPVVPSINNLTNHNNNKYHSNRNEQQQQQRDGKQNDNNDDHQNNYDHNDDDDHNDEHDTDYVVNDDVLPCQFQCNYKQILLQQDDYDYYNNDNNDGNDDVHKQQHIMNATMMNDDDDDENVNTHNQLILNYHTKFLQQQQYYDDLKHIDYTYIDYGYYYYTYNNNNSDDHNSNCNSYNEVVDSPTTTTTSTSTVELSPTEQEQEQQPQYTDYDIKDNTRCYYTPLIIQQSKHIPGKGGFCWDAAFILGEYITYQILLQKQQSGTLANKSTTTTSMIELGCGTGICGMYIAKSLLQLQGKELQQQQYRQYSKSIQKQYKQLYHITITDMDGPIQDLIHHNLLRNFDHSYHLLYQDDITTKQMFYKYFQQYPLWTIQQPEQVQQQQQQQHEQLHHNCNDEGHETTGTTTIYTYDTTTKPLPQYFHDDNDDIIHPCCTINRMVLDWDDCYDIIHKSSNNNNDNSNNNSDDNDNNTATSQRTQIPKTYDIVFGSDIVASIYDPIKLAYTVHSLCHTQSIVYISYKERLSTIHTLFHDTLINLFHHVTIFNTVSSKIILTTSPERKTAATTLHVIDIQNSAVITEETKDLSSLQQDIIDDTNHYDQHHLKLLPWTSCSNQNPNVYIIIAHSKITTNTNITNK